MGSNASSSTVIIVAVVYNSNKEGCLPAAHSELWSCPVRQSTVQCVQYSKLVSIVQYS